MSRYEENEADVPQAMFRIRVYGADGRHRVQAKELGIPGIMVDEGWVTSYWAAVQGAVRAAEMGSPKVIVTDPMDMSTMEVVEGRVVHPREIAEMQEKLSPREFHEALREAAQLDQAEYGLRLAGGNRDMMEALGPNFRAHGPRDLSIELNNEPPEGVRVYSIPESKKAVVVGRVLDACAYAVSEGGSREKCAIVVIPEWMTTRPDEEGKKAIAAALRGKTRVIAAYGSTKGGRAAASRLPDYVPAGVMIEVDNPVRPNARWFDIYHRGPGREPMGVSR